MNPDKTKVTFNEDVLLEPVAVHITVFKVFLKYIDLEQILKLDKISLRMKN